MIVRYLALLFTLAQMSIAESAVHVVIIEGLGGEPTYAEEFERQGELIEGAVASIAEPKNIRRLSNTESTWETIGEHLGRLANSLTANDIVILFFLGHGSWDDYDYKFNIPGKDLSGDEFLSLLEALPTKNQLVVNTSSASGALTEKLAVNGRVVISATKSGAERHATRFGRYFADALISASADTNKNDSISAAEAFAYASRQVADYYESENRLATEHPRLQGERAAQFRLARLTPEPAENAAVDPEFARLIADRDEINEKIDTLQLSRDTKSDDLYRSELQSVLLELAIAEEIIELYEIDSNDPD